MQPDRLISKSAQPITTKTMVVIVEDYIVVLQLRFLAPGQDILGQTTI